MDTSTDQQKKSFHPSYSAMPHLPVIMQESGMTINNLADYSVIRAYVVDWLITFRKQPTDDDIKRALNAYMEKSNK